MILLSTYLNIGNKLNEKKVFDQILDLDANYFININRVKDTSIGEFKNSYKKINDYFKDIGILLQHSKGSNDRFYKGAIKKFNFHEVNGIGLGYSKGKKGSGFGKELTQKIIQDAKEIIDAGTKEPEIFHLIGLFEENVGPDRLSDMFATLLEDEIKQYTRRINMQLGINKMNYPNLEFNGEFLINPYKNDIVLLLPEDILHELPIAKDWDDIDRVCKEIEEIKKDVNGLVTQNWSKVGSAYKKEYIRRNLIDNKELLNKIITEYKKSKVDKYDFQNDPLGLSILASYISKIKQEDLLEDIVDEKRTTFQITKCICERFKYQIENKKAYQILYTDDLKPRKEKIAQQLFLCIAEAYCKANNIDLSPECNIGRGPVDFKTSKGDKDKTLVEIKLTTNSQLVHGLEIQLAEYSKAEETQNLIYLVIHNGGPEKRIDKMYEVYGDFSDDKEKPVIVLIDAVPKESASKY